jgi:hypothetical protein
MSQEIITVSAQNEITSQQEGNQSARLSDFYRQAEARISFLFSGKLIVDFSDYRHV